jgi:drug/metabolite transporter (DMT)-like permease
MARVMSENLSVPLQVGARSAVALAFLAIAVRVRRVSLDVSRATQVRACVLGVTFALTGFLYTVAANNTKLTNVVFVFLALGPVASVLLARLLFGERIRPPLLVAISLTLLGIFAISPPTSSFDIGVAAAIGAGLLSGGSNIARRWLKDVDWMVVVFFQSAVTVALSAFVTVVDPGEAVHGTAAFPFAMVAISAVSTLAVSALLLYGYRHLDVGTGSLILSTELIFVLLLGWLAYGEVPTNSEWLGCSIIAAGTLLAVHASRRAATLEAV